MDSSAAELPAKYQRLAAEYAKLRAQVPVLKKAVLDEQAKETQLKDEVKQKDQTIRRSEQEIDSLNFRNQQLSKRVTMLQQELDDATAKPKKGKAESIATLILGQQASQARNHDESSSFDNDVVGEELQKKIAENAELHKQVYDLESQSKSQIMALQDKISTLEHNSTRHDLIVNELKDRHKLLVDKLQQDKVTLEVKFVNLETEARQLKALLKSSEQQLKNVHDEFSGPLERATKNLQEKLPFNDTENNDISTLNVPPYDKNQETKLREVIQNLGTLVRDFATALCDYHTYTHQRCQIYPLDASTEPISSNNRQLCKLLLENSQHIQIFQDAFATFQGKVQNSKMPTLEAPHELHDVSQAFHSYITYHRKLLPCHLLSLEEESAVSACPSDVKKRNMEVHASLSKLVSVLNRLDKCFSSIAAQSDINCDQIRVDHAHLLEQLSSALHNFHDELKGLCKHYNGKIILEKGMITTSQKLHSVNESLLSSLITMVTCTGKISAVVATNLDFFKSTILTSNAKPAKVTQSLLEQASEYMSSLCQPIPESVPYEEAIANQHIVQTCTQSRDSVNAQLISAQEKINTLEQDKEHWMLEAKLLQIRLEKLQNDRSKVNAERDSGVSASFVDSSATARSTSSAGSGIQATISTDLSSASKANSVLDAGDSRAREDLIREHFSERITSISQQLQQADSKAAVFYAETQTLIKRLRLAESERDELQSTVAQLKDELQTTTKNYEGQLSLMSDHLCTMNDKLSRQTDEINALKETLHSNSKQSRKLNLRGNK